MSLLLSVIIPAYNVEKYIEKCIRSVEQQDLDLNEYEVIVVDDASTDSTGEIIARLAKEYDNIKVITNKQNLSMGPSRNRAIEMACGKYIMFADSDDYYEQNVFAGLLNRMDRENLDMLHFAFNNVNTSGRVISKVHSNYPEDCVMTGEEMIVPEKFLAYVWSYVWRRDTIVKSGVKMPAIAFEDIEFTLKMLALSERTGYTSAEYYNYQRRPQSILRCFNPQRHIDMAQAFLSIKEFFESSGRELKWQSVKPVAQSYLFRELRYVIKKRVGVEKELLQYIFRMNLMPIPNTFNSFRIKLFNYNPELFIVYYKIIKFPVRTKQLISRKPII